jgi:hypothetical protein
MAGSLSLPRGVVRATSTIGVLLIVLLTRAYGKQRPFSVADDIAFAYFGDPFQDKAEPLTFSPNGRYFVVQTEQGRLDINRPESSLRVYSMVQIKSWLSHPEVSANLSPLWRFSRSTYKDGPVISQLRWLRDSSGFVFLAKAETGADRLFLADLRTRKIRPLTPENQRVTGFDIRDQNNFVYTALSPAIQEQINAETFSASVVGTDRRLASLLSPEATIHWHDRSEIWGVVAGKRIRVMDPQSHRALSIHWRGQMALALSPDNHTVLTALSVPMIPDTWPRLYPPPYSSDLHHIIPGEQNPDAFDGWFDVSRYVLIDLATNSIKALPLGPIGYEADWIGLPYTSWSSDGRFVAITNTFLDREAANAASVAARPCAVVVEISQLQASCLETVLGNKSNGEHEEGFRLVDGIMFDRDDDDRVTVKFTGAAGTRGSTVYVRSSGGAWKPDGASKNLTVDRPIRISIRQSLNDPPVLAATDPTSQTSRVIWDPNPWLKNIELGDVSVYKWKDDTGRVLLGGLFKPPHFDASKRYPLVIQTHGFSETAFIPSGVYPEGFAARELAAAGFLVLQVRGCPIRHTPEEGPCQVEAYDSAVTRLVSEGLADPGHVGIVGFSRTCYYALKAITIGKVHYEAASVTDGIDMGYLQYILSDKAYSPDMMSVIGAAPFADGLSQWLQRSPEFNMDKVTTPLLVVGVGQFGMLTEWEPYSTLWHLEKPVDLIVLKEGTHPLTNPAQRMVSQGSTVDWMRFWLLGEEDPDPAKRDQYARWSRLRQLSEQSHRQAGGQ